MSTVAETHRRAGVNLDETEQLAERYLTGALFRQILARIERAGVAPDVIAWDGPSFVGALRAGISAEGAQERQGLGEKRDQRLWRCKNQPYRSLRTDRTGGQALKSSPVTSVERGMQIANPGKKCAPR